MTMKKKTGEYYKEIYAMVKKPTITEVTLVWACIENGRK